MLSIEACKKILQKNGAKYTEDEIKKIRHLLYKLGNLDYLLFNQNKSLKDGKRNSLYKGING